ncbi:uncharacterized protein LOC130555732 isoform X2 [Triplophysa rosa]|uniref:uncharacterized protein LOC130555732 isoform X2 n=1 Tax=Triplophysa rosa TaxID=992332 RepID=UPI002545E84D|nr:uncharacterized protein LOC130555732 isoform X2 [Triplophysa rosa]
MKHFVLMCLLLYIHMSQSEIHSQSSTEGADVSLYCKHEGKVQWSKHSDGNRWMILTAESKEKIEKHNPDPHNRYSVLDDLSLHIKNVSLSDSGIYYCNNNTAVNLTVTASGSTTSNNNQTEATTPPPEISISTISLGVNTSVAQTSNARHTDQLKSTQVKELCCIFPAKPTSENSSVHNSGSQTNTPVTSTTELSTTSTRSSTRTEETNINITSTTSRATTPAPPPTDSSKIAAAVSGGVVFVVLVLLLWACIKRKDISAALSNKKENIYETVVDSDFTTQPVPSQKPNDAIYYLAGDPDIVQLGQIKETDDHTYTLISQSKENITEREEDVPLYSTIKVDTIN